MKRIRICPFKKFWERAINTTADRWNHCWFYLWSKMSTFQDSVVLCKSSATPIPTEWFKTTNENFQWGNLWHSMWKSIRITKNRSWNFQKHLFYYVKRKVYIFRIILMPLWVKKHILPHFKALSSGIKYLSGHGVWQHF